MFYKLHRYAFKNLILKKINKIKIDLKIRMWYIFDILKIK